MENKSMFDNIANALTTLCDTVDFIVKQVSKIDFSKLIDTFEVIGEYASYHIAIDELQWPLYNIRDKQFRNDIIELHKSNATSEQINNAIFSFFTEEYIEGMRKRWLKTTTINTERYPVLSQAIELHSLGYYYASTSILMCQLYGLASDINKIANHYQLKLTQKDKNDIADVFELDVKYIDREKGKLLQMLFISDINTGTWYSFAKYIKEIVLDSSSSQLSWSTQPLRNKICHGDQLCFGTKEHSLKAILIIDLLIKLADELKYYAEHSSEDCNNE